MDFVMWLYTVISRHVVVTCPHQIKVNGCFLFVTYYSGNCLSPTGSYERDVFEKTTNCQDIELTTNLVYHIKKKNIYNQNGRKGIQPK